MLRPIVDLVRKRLGHAHIRRQRDRKVQRTVDPVLYKKRNVIERHFCKVKHSRHVAIRFDKLARNFKAAVMLASVHIRLGNYYSTAQAVQLNAGYVSACQWIIITAASSRLDLETD
jgi:hypothetical protein